MAKPHLSMVTAAVLAVNITAVMHLRVVGTEVEVVFHRWQHSSACSHSSEHSWLVQYWGKSPAYGM